MNCFENNFQIKDERPVFDVKDIVISSFGNGCIPSQAIDLRPAGYARLDAVARERGASIPQVALAWLLGRPGIAAPIVGASKMAHLEELVAAAAMKLEPAEIAALDAGYQPHPVLGHA